MARAGRRRRVRQAAEERRQPGDWRLRRNTVMRIKLTVNGAELTGTLGEGAAARDFAALLPLTVELADFHGRERVADLPRPLDLAGEPAGTTAQPGDIAHYAPWDNMALF